MLPLCSNMELALERHVGVNESVNPCRIIGFIKAENLPFETTYEHHGHHVRRLKATVSGLQ